MPKINMDFASSSIFFFQFFVCYEKCLFWNQNSLFEIHYSQFEFKFGFYDDRLNGQNGKWINSLVNEINQIFEQTAATSSTIILTLTMTTKKAKRCSDFKANDSMHWNSLFSLKKNAKTKLLFLWITFFCFSIFLYHFFNRKNVLLCVCLWAIFAFY